MKHLIFSLITFFLLPFFACMDAGPPTACECITNTQHVVPNSDLVDTDITLPPLDTALSKLCDAHVRSMSSGQSDAWLKESDACKYFTVDFKRDISKLSAE